MESCVAFFQASLWRESGHSYSPWQAKSTRQVLARLGGRHGRVYSYPADKVSRERERERGGQKSTGVDGMTGKERHDTTKIKPIDPSQQEGRKGNSNIRTML